MRVACSLKLLKSLYTFVHTQLSNNLLQHLAKRQPLAASYKIKMIANENIQYEQDFVEYDISILNKLKKEFKLSLFYDIISCLIVSILMAILLRQYGNPVFHRILFINEWALSLLVCTVIWCFKNETLIKYIQKYYDLKDQKIIIIESKIKQITHFKSHCLIVVDHSSYRNISFRIIKKVSYENPRVNDFIKMVFLPRTKIVLNMKIT